MVILGFHVNHIFEWESTLHRDTGVNCLLYVLALCLMANMCNFESFAHSGAAGLLIDLRLDPHSI